MTVLESYQRRRSSQYQQDLALGVVHPDLPDAILRSTGWQLVLRQGSPADAEKMSALFGTTWCADTSTGSDGRTFTRTAP